MPDFLPRRDHDLVLWARNFSARLNQDPERYKVSPERLAQLNERIDAFDGAWQLAVAPGTRTQPAIRGKDDARKRMVKLVRETSLMIRAVSSVSREERELLGFHVGPGRDGKRRRIPKPDRAPVIGIVEIKGSRLDLFLSDPESPSRKALPRDVMFVHVFVAIAAHLPEMKAPGWRWPKISGESRVIIDAGSQCAPGDTAWIRACYVNARGEWGPFSAAVPATINYGGGIWPKRLLG